MRTHSVFAVGLVGLATNSALGAFTGFSAEYITLPNGHVVQNIYANFSSSNDRLLNIYNTNITTTNPGGFHQSAANPNWRPGTNQNRQTSDDSWVTLGSNPDGSGRANGATVGDPNFVNFDDTNGATDFSYVDNDGSGAGWYYLPTETAWGTAWDMNRVLAAHFVWVAPPNGGVATTGWEVSVILVIGGQTQIANPPAEEFDYDHVPSPGVLAFLGMVGIAGGRRRVST